MNSQHYAPSATSPLTNYSQGYAKQSYTANQERDIYMSTTDSTSSYEELNTQSPQQLSYSQQRNCQYADQYDEWSMLFGASGPAVQSSTESAIVQAMRKQTGLNTKKEFYPQSSQSYFELSEQ